AHVAVLVGGQVATQVAAQTHGRAARLIGRLLQRPDLLLLQATGGRVHLEAERLGCQYLADPPTFSCSLRPPWSKHSTPKPRRWEGSASFKVIMLSG
ncbi:hypothetical protein LEMLEM_LOCUS20902, partial [Lemmus lemmus]